MQLCYSPTSPYVRKVMVTAIELDLVDRIELVPSVVWTPDTPVAALNPLGKVPTLSTVDGRSIFDSPVICEYLNHLRPGVSLYPENGSKAHWWALCLQSAADGIMDAAILRLRESMRPEGERSQEWDAHQKLTMERTVQYLEENIEHITSGPITIGRIAVGVMLGYLDFRYSHEDWRPGHPGLEAFYDDFSQRESMQETIPKAPQ